VLGEDDFEAWFRLLETPGVGRETARRLLAACGTPQAIFTSHRASLRALAGPAVAEALTALPPDHAARLRVAQRWLQGGADRTVLTLGDPDYPPRLLQTADPPLLLYVQGRVQALSAAGVAVVGSRHPTAQGADNARAFGAALSERGLLVHSGLAVGIDGAAHEGALTAAAGTVAVVGTGLDRVYPAQHEGLARRIAAHGALVSEYAPGTPPLGVNFPQRNRIIAGLAQGTLVVEAGLPSGSLITARLAAEAGREVFAIPGSIHAPQSKGCHALLKQGAKLVETAQDIVEELRNWTPRQAPLPLSAIVAAGDPLLDGLGSDPVTIDALMARTGWPAADLTARLFELELDGHVARLPGGLYQRRFSA
jgi:DNA processing protein